MGGERRTLSAETRLEFLAPGGQRWPWVNQSRRAGPFCWSL